ncbi:16S rRNA (adenine(1518)-N(6)/adenine(1519)-N(6))-dimethyltransferase RsmA [Lentilactobacillus laojiaonis]|uniref:16S rRNA (adenine(1518)-N(6)/adenine(1519)-N(6))- dimethyltransferase RsmA n=1 Tax=Lentilactobacillus laojiaonis TaxID=2883998 RepID=UPI001D0B398C|nr:16S rRNA (adenine(1518)-N(6)/adenine(1519)-N(6))-dimethyltransferase RsmA [Lentilactobacillus laojiaonis]UDM31944.1 16S rRNA (adenine(1518)-N(6)/adenine(1519)-N(6))-dimethyltransferase RsmA [Lentilactobacillus laojiaonis]
MSNNPDIANPARTQAILNTYHLSAKKSLGQNFLTDLNILNNIVEAADITDEDNVIEIGPGIGALTEQLAKKAHKVVAFEIDQNLLPVLDETLSPYDNIKIINQDILKANLPQIVEQEFESNKSLKVVANLPYYITTPIILDLLKNPVEFDTIVVMMQKEVAKRITANPDNKDYGSLSIIVQEMKQAEIAFEVPRTAFVPQPNVDSAIVKLSNEATFAIEPFDQSKFFGFVRGCFMHRRKSFWNNLLGIFGKDPEVKQKITAVLDEVKVSPSIRSEQLTIEQFIVLCNAFHRAGLV